MKHVVKSLYVEIKRDEYEGLRARVAELEAKQQPATPAARWRIDGEADPHGERYDCERADLALGVLTDDELANAVFMHGNEMPDFQRVLAGTAKMPIVYLTAAKDRIRWLSRALAGATANHNEQSLNMVPDGYVVVPVEPTPEMIAAVAKYDREYFQPSWVGTWREFLAAAPSAQQPVKTCGCTKLCEQRYLASDEVGADCKAVHGQKED